MLQLMRKHHSTLLLPLLVRMLDHGAISFDVVLSLLQVKGNDGTLVTTGPSPALAVWGGASMH